MWLCVLQAVSGATPMSTMTRKQASLQSLLREKLRQGVRVQKRPDGTILLHTPFVFPDGDRFPIKIGETASGGLRLSDCGHTLMHISYEHDVDAFMEGDSGNLLKGVMGEASLQWDGDSGALCIDTTFDRLTESIFTFGQALTRIYDLAQN